ncbi:MAG TPA: YafY family protein [Mesorhizobium sp.]|jgi:predicted DNA-binding transcriptional regulator YafY|nr:YafY family protein [Mesorhizobium sp.]
MRKASRLFEIIQMLRAAKRPLTAGSMAEVLEVTTRSVYRDIAALQAMRVPIEGERGLGYILRPGFHLPPLMFSIEETEALIVSLALLERTADAGLKEAAHGVARKIAAAVPLPLRRVFETSALHAWGTVMPPPPGVDLGLLRQTIREERKLFLRYRDGEGRATERTVRPLALIYYSEMANLVAWCELRGEVRQFRAERVEHAEALAEHFSGEGDRLRRLWMDGWTNRPAAPRPVAAAVPFDAGELLPAGPLS